MRQSPFKLRTTMELMNKRLPMCISTWSEQSKHWSSLGTWTVRAKYECFPNIPINHSLRHQSSHLNTKPFERRSKTSACTDHPCPIADHMESFSTSAFKVPIWIFEGHGKKVIITLTVYPRFVWISSSRHAEPWQESTLRQHLLRPSQQKKNVFLTPLPEYLADLKDRLASL